jgi:ATP-dependent Clp protease ATP-binding subunit ClpC
MTKIPVSKMNSDETNKLSSLADNLSSKVIGQSEAVSKIAKSIRRNRLGIKDPSKPIGSFIFLGSTGVGKCIIGDTEIIVRNKITGEIKTIKIENIITDTNKP